MIAEKRKAVDTKPPKPEFPCLGVHEATGLIVLFTEPGVGTVVFKGDSEHKIGSVSRGWVGVNFSTLPEDEEIVLRN